MLEFNLGEHIKLKFYLPSKSYVRYFKNEYLRVSISKSNLKSRIIIETHVVSDLPSPDKGDVNSRIRVKGLFWFEYIVSGIHTSNPKIYFKRHWVDRLYINAIAVFLQAQILEPLIYLKLLDYQILLMHSAGVSNDSQGYIFPAHSGTGKTTLSLRLINYGFKLLGDDLLYIDTRKAMVSPYPRPLHLFSYNIKTLNGARVPLNIRFKVYFKNLIRFFLEKILKDQFLISTRVHVERLYSDFQLGETSKIRKIIFLKRGGKHEKVSLASTENRLKVIKDIICSADLNKSLEKNLLRYEEEKVVLRQKESAVLDLLLRQFSYIDYVDPNAISKEAFYEFLNILNS